MKLTPMGALALGALGGLVVLAGAMGLLKYQVDQITANPVGFLAGSLAGDA